MAMGYIRGKTLCAAVRLEIADALGDGEQHLDELAVATGSDRDALYRLLRALAGIGVLTEVTPFCFALTPLGQPLRRDAPGSVWASIVLWADLLADSWTYLAECVRAGGDLGALAVMEREGVKSRWSREPDAQAIFHAAFAEPTASDMATVAGAYDFSRCHVVADLGGAGGGLLSAILAAHPEARGILVDRKEAIDGAARRLAATGMADRCDLVAGDLLEAVPGGADAYIMKSVLHGYNDASARRILTNCFTSMTAESRLLLMEVVLPVQIDRATRGSSACCLPTSTCSRSPVAGSAVRPSGSPSSHQPASSFAGLSRCPARTAASSKRYQTVAVRRCNEPHYRSRTES